MADEQPTNDGTPRLIARVYEAARDLLHVDWPEQARLLRHLAKWITFGAMVGVLAGLSSAVFLEVLDWATETRLDNPWLIGLLPVGGLAVGLAYHYGGGRSSEGNNLILDEIHEPRRGCRAAWRRSCSPVPSSRSCSADRRVERAPRSR